MCLNGAFIAIELKSEMGTPDPLQVYNLDSIANCGGIALVMTPQNANETLIFLEKISKSMAKYSKPTSPVQ